MEFNLINILGIIGLVEVLYAYALLSIKKCDSDSMQYQWLNMTGAICLAINGWAHKAYPIFALNVIWALIGAVVIGKALFAKVKS